MIEVQELTKEFADHQAVRGISFSAAAGQIVGFLGPNGAGKTTTMRMLTGFLPPSSGTASIAGFDVQDAPDEVRRRIGYLPETPPLYPEMTVDSYLLFVARLKGMPRSRLRAACNQALEKTNLVDVRHRILGHLSKGYRQRVGLAQAIVHEPEVLILDEPTVGLDPGQIIEIRELIRSLAGDHTVILSTHILPEVAETCEKIVIINEGHLTREATMAEIQGEGSLEQAFLEAIRLDHAERPVT
ncbi:MAG TPA: MFS transporter [Deltaproteobacteria bacterium]|nr:MFS transporter [Deltaproteobacteria bacterium]